MLRRWILCIALLAAPGPVGALPILNEVLYDADGADAPSVFTEIVGPPGTLLDGWSLVGVNGSTGSPYRVVDLTGAVLPADGVLVVATAAAAGDVLPHRDHVGEVDWQNGPDAVELWNALGDRVDALQYGLVSGWTLGEGAPAPDAPAGFALTRDLRSTDTGDNASDFAVELPTPGIGGTLPLPEPPGVPEPPPPEPVPVPEPGGLPALALGCLALVAHRERASRSGVTSRRADPSAR